MDKITPISDVVWFQEGPGVRNTQYTTEGVKLLNVANLVDGEVDLSNTNRYISEDEAYGKYKHFLVDEGDLIIASSGIKVDYFDKKMGFIKEKHLPLCMNTSTIRFKTLNTDVLDMQYFMYFLKSESFKQQLAVQITGSAQLNFGPSHLKKMNVKIVPIAQQKAIVHKLSKIDLLIFYRQQQLLKLDKLVKAQFIEMFGNVISNSKNWSQYRFGDITTSRLGKMLDSKQQTGKCSFPYLANFNVQWFRFELDKLNVMDFDEKDQKEFELIDGDLLVCEGGEIGRCAVWHNEMQPCFFQKALHRVRCNKDIVLPDYMAYWFKYNCDHNGFSDIAGAKATIAHLPGAKLKKLIVTVPPLVLQHEFATFVEQIDKSKFEVQQSLEKLETLKKSLMQQFFG